MARRRGKAYRTVEEVVWRFISGVEHFARTKLAMPLPPPELVKAVEEEVEKEKGSSRYSTC